MTFLTMDGSARREAQAARRTAIEIGGVALLVLSVHAGFMALSQTRHEAQSERGVPPMPLPVTVELTRQPVPVPLPQAKQAPQSVKRAPQPRPLNRAPAPKPAPAVTPQTPTPPRAAMPADTAVAHVPAPSTSAPAVAPASVAETEPVGDTAYLHNPAPDYPPIAQDRRWEGRVLLHVRAGERPT